MRLPNGIIVKMPYVNLYDLYNNEGNTLWFDETYIMMLMDNWTVYAYIEN